MIKMGYLTLDGVHLVLDGRQRAQICRMQHDLQVSWAGKSEDGPLVGTYPSDLEQETFVPDIHAAPLPAGEQPRPRAGRWWPPLFRPLAAVMLRSCGQTCCLMKEVQRDKE